MALSAWIAVALLAAIAIFQVSLAAGAPLAGAAWGGRHRGVLPARLRMASAAAGLILYPLIILYVLATAGQCPGLRLPGAGAPAMWVLVGLFTLGAAANFASPSRLERLWGPISLALALCCALVATAL